MLIEVSLRGASTSQSQQDVSLKFKGLVAAATTTMIGTSMQQRLIKLTTTTSIYIFIYMHVNLLGVWNCDDKYVYIKWSYIV